MTTDPQVQAAILTLIPGSVPVGTWTVRQIADSTRACTMLDTREAHLPAGTLPEDRMILLHEEGHVRWDLPSADLLTAFPAITMPYVADFYKMLREWVIDMRLTAYVEDIRPSANLLDWSRMPDPAAMPLDAVARTWMQWYYRSLHPSVKPECQLYVKECWSLLDAHGQALLTQAYQEIKASLLDDTVSETWAVRLAAHFLPPPPPPQPPAQPPEDGSVAGRRQQAAQDAEQTQRAAQDARQADQAARQSTKMDSAQAVNEATEQSFSPLDAVDDDGFDQYGQTPSQQLGDGSGPDGSKGSGGPPVPTIPIHVHLDKRRTGKRIKDPLGMKTSGTVPTHTEYLRTGGAIFKEAPKPAGTILIDVSSSMNWSEGQLQEAIRLAPNLIVAGYSYGNVGPMLCVIARGGRSSQSIPCASGGGNSGTDLPALLWLAKQPEPRVIVSDGGYYGTSDIGSDGAYYHATNYIAVCNAIMKRAKITRVQTMNAAISWLKGRLTPASPGADNIPTTPSRRRR